MIFMLQGPLDQFFHMGQPSLNPSGSAKRTHRKGSEDGSSCLGHTMALPLNTGLDTLITINMPHCCHSGATPWTFRRAFVVFHSSSEI